MVEGDPIIGEAQKAVAREAFAMLARQVVDAFCAAKGITSDSLKMTREELRGLIAGALSGYDILITAKITEMVEVAGAKTPDLRNALASETEVE